jgi:hypothetical protein
MKYDGFTCHMSDIIYGWIFFSFKLKNHIDLGYKPISKKMKK